MPQPTQTPRSLRWLLVAAAVLLAAALLNLEQRGESVWADDGVRWVRGSNGVLVAAVEAGGPADAAGLRPGDRLLSLNGARVSTPDDAARRLGQARPWTKTEYRLERQGVRFTAELVLRPASRQRAAAAFQWILGAAYLGLGLFTLKRQGGRPLVRLFFGFSLASFVLFTFSYSGRLDAFDRFIYWSDVWAGWLAPAIFLHFCLAFPEGRLTSWRRRGALAAYAVAAVALATHHTAASGLAGSAAEQRLALDRLWLAAFGAQFLIGAALLFWKRRRAADPLVERQLRWLANGAFWGAAPFCAFYVAPFVGGQTPGPNHSLAIFSLALLPTAFAFSIARHRLMDVDVALRRGAAYAAAAVAVLAAFYGAFYLLTGSAADGLRPAAWIASVVAAGLLFQPLRRLIQREIDRRYFRHRYDERRTLADFAVELAAETDRDHMLQAVGERLERTLDLARLAVISVAEPASDGRLQVAYSRGFVAPGDLDLSFLTPNAVDPKRRYLLFEQPAQADLAAASQRAAAAELDLNYYVPCEARGRTIAWLGLGRTLSGEFLTTEDLALVRAISGNLAIALENARLYQSLEQKALEYERLKDYNENIVESLHVGILAVDLDDRVESWNTQLELVFGISRQQAVGRRLRELIPAALADQFDQVRGESGVHEIYKLSLRAEDFPQEFRPAHAAGPTHVVNVAVAPLISKRFEPIGRLIILDDVTERAQLEERVVQADKLSSIGLLAAGVAHEVNTPLAVISSYAQMLAKQIEGDPAREKILTKITQQTFRASEIVNSLLSFSRTSQHSFAPVALDELLGETLALVAPQLRKAGVRVVERLDPGTPAVRGVANKLQQVFLNLFLNARDAMSDGGVLEVRTQRVDDPEGDRVRVTVRDSGVGMDREQLGRIFDPFFTTKGPQRGTGLGLSVTYGIVREHGGTIGVDSSPGAGATFTVELPAARQAVHA